MVSSLCGSIFLKKNQESNRFYNNQRTAVPPFPSKSCDKRPYSNPFLKRSEHFPQTFYILSFIDTLTIRKKLVMITLYRGIDDIQADKIGQRLDDLVLAYRTEVTERHNTPFIKDGDSVIRGDKQIEAWLLDLEKELIWQRSLSGDGCYVDPSSGEVC